MSMNFVFRPQTTTVPAKRTRYPRHGDCCDECGARLSGEVLSIVAIKERLIPYRDGQVGYEGPEFWPITYFCSPGCARFAPKYLARHGIQMTEPGTALKTACASCGNPVDRTRFAVNLVLDSVKTGGKDADCRTLFDFATVCPDCSPWN